MLLQEKKISFSLTLLRYFTLKRQVLGAYYEAGTGEEWRPGLKVRGFTLAKPILLSSIKERKKRATGNIEDKH